MRTDTGKKLGIALFLAWWFLLLLLFTSPSYPADNFPSYPADNCIEIDIGGGTYIVCF